MPISTKYAYGLTWDEVRSGIGLGYFPYSQLTGETAVIAPLGGFVVIAGIDQTDFPNGYNHVIIVNAFIGSNSGEGTAIVTANADDEGKVTYLDAGVEKSVLDKGVILNCDLADEATYYIVLQTGNNIGSQPVIPIFSGTPPPPNKTTTPTITTPALDDEWGSVTISWTTPDDLDTEVMGFRIWAYASYPGAVAYVVGTVPALSATHPNYSFTYAIGANEWPSPTDEYRFTVEPYIFDSPPLNDPPTGTLGEESDPSDPVIYDPDSPPPPPVDPDIELPNPEEVPVPVEDLDPPFEDPETGEPLPPGTLSGSGYGGFNIGGSSLDDVVFMMNVSGIYTLVEDKTHDTLYERMTGITTQDVKIPDPFVKTGFVGE